MNRHCVTPAVVLSRRSSGEWDRVVVLYTRALGRLTARLPGAGRPAAKLKALSEPAVWGEYRLYLRPASPWATATGGRVLDTFPRLRADLGSTVEALTLCEVLRLMTPELSPSPDKHDLIVEHLTALEAGGSAWLGPSFALKALGLAGVEASWDPAAAAADEGSAGRGVSARTRWEALRRAPAREVARWEPDALLDPFRARAEAAVEAYAETALMTRAFRLSLAAGAAAPRAGGRLPSTC